jgi:enterobactin synthetase component D
MNMRFITDQTVPPEWAFITQWQGVSVHLCQFDKSLFRDELFAQLGIHFPQNLAKAVDKRKSEFLAGRYCAAKAMENCGLPVVDIGIGEKREPLWPPGTTASISHSKNHAVCLLSDAPTTLGLGIDIEIVMPEERAEKLHCMIVDADELQFLQHIELPFNHALTLVFSAKESLYKTLYPQVRRYFDFLDAKIIHLDIVQKTFTLQLKKDLSAQCKSSDVYVGQYEFYENKVLSAFFLS